MGLKEKVGRNSQSLTIFHYGKHKGNSGRQNHNILDKMGFRLGDKVRHDYDFGCGNPFHGGAFNRKAFGQLVLLLRGDFVGHPYGACGRSQGLARVRA